MSKVIFITSQKEINLDRFGIGKIEVNDYMLKHYPYLKKFNFIYDFEEFNHSKTYKGFINDLLELTQDNKIYFIVLWQTQNIEEIYELNANIKNKNLVSKNSDKFYDLIYRLESNTLLPSTEYEFSV